MDYSNIDDIIGGFTKLLSLSSVGSVSPVPIPLILSGVPRRGGLSAIKIASRIISRKSEAGLPVGVLPSGSVSPDEIMERIRMEEWIRAIQEEAVITIAFSPGIAVSATGANAGGPIQVIGSTTVPFKGYGVIQ